MTQTPSGRDWIYANMADALERDPVQGGEHVNRSTVPMGRGFALWQRINPTAQLVWVDDAEGRPRALTPRQAEVLAMALEMADGVGMTMRQMASALKVAPSTVSRALTKLSAWGLICYFVGRGRWAGLVIFRRQKDDGFDRMRKLAKARVQRWSEAAKRRLSRLQINVAPYFLERKEVGNDSLYPYLESLVTMDATLTAQPFSVQDLRDVGII